MKISVIIPVYKVENYLHQCIGSVLEQTFENIEIILVNDGSPDRCGEICEEYANTDKRIIAIHKENGGLSEARNVGISKASGDYVMFLDGDDFWDDATALMRLAERLEQTNADVLNYTYKKFFEDRNQYVPYLSQREAMPTYGARDEQLQYLAEHGLYIASACNKLIRRNLLEGLSFQQGIYSEDIVWCAKLIEKAQSMDFVCENFYCYRQRADSIRHTITDKKCNDLVQNILTCLDMAKQAPKETQRLLRSYTAFQYGTFFAVQAQAEHSQLRYIEELAKHQWIMSYHGSNKKLRILYIGCKLIGYKNVCRMIRMIYRR